MIYNPKFHLSPLISEIIKVFGKHHYKDLEEKLRKIAIEKRQYFNDLHNLDELRDMSGLRTLQTKCL